MYRKILSRVRALPWRMIQVRFRHSNPLCPKEIDYTKVEKVTICGANNPLGQHLAFMLKKSDIIMEIALHDDGNVRGLALDLEHMNTKTKVRPNSGDYELATALRNTDIVVITNGFDTDEGSIIENARMIYKYGIKIASVCPHALVCIVTPPINIMVQVFSETMKCCNLYDPNRIFGVPSLVEMRANSIIADYLSIDPSAIAVPIIGGVTNNTVVPILSRARPYNEFTHAELVKLTNLIMEVPHDCKRLHTAAPLSTAYAVARFVLTLAAGLCRCECAIQTAFVRSDIIKEISYFASSLKFGTQGAVENYGIPKLQEYEMNLLNQALVVLQKDYTLGMKVFEEVQDCKKPEEEPVGTKKPFITKVPCPQPPYCFPTDVCQEKLPDDPCAPSFNKICGY